MGTVKTKANTIKALLYLKEAIDSGRIQQCATRNGVKQSNLSTLLMELESDMNTKFLYRSSSGVVPTNAAQQIYDDIGEIEKILARIQSVFLKPEDLSGSITMCAEEGFLSNYLLKLMSDLYAQYPNIRLDVLTAKDVNLATVDVVVVHDHSVSIPVGPRLLETTRKTHFYSTKAYLDKYGKPKDLADLLENFDLCLWSSFLKWPECRIINKKAKHLNMTADVLSLVLNLIKDREGIGLFPDWYALLNPELVLLDNIDFELVHHFQVICRPGYENKPKIKALIKLLQDNIDQLKVPTH